MKNSMIFENYLTFLIFLQFLKNQRNFQKNPAFFKRDRLSMIFDWFLKNSPGLDQLRVTGNPMLKSSPSLIETIIK